MMASWAANLVTSKPGELRALDCVQLPAQRHLGRLTAGLVLFLPLGERPIPSEPRRARRPREVHALRGVRVERDLVGEHRHRPPPHAWRSARFSAANSRRCLRLGRAARAAAASTAHCLWFNLAMLTG